MFAISLLSIMFAEVYFVFAFIIAKAICVHFRKYRWLNIRSEHYIPATQRLQLLIPQETTHIYRCLTEANYTVYAVTERVHAVNCCSHSFIPMLMKRVHPKLEFNFSIYFYI